jgi:hypothetical protein
MVQESIIGKRLYVFIISMLLTILYFVDPFLVTAIDSTIYSYAYLNGVIDTYMKQQRMSATI